MLDLAEWFINYVVMPVMGLFLIGCVFVAVVLFGGLLMGYKLPSEVAYKQCLTDGQKEYVCYSMIYGRGAK